MRMNTIKEKLSALRVLMKKNGIDAYIIPRADEYQGEFVAACDERLQWLTGFTGSAGVAIVLHDKAVVMSDGRYTLQLASQIKRKYFQTANSVKVKPEDWLAEHLGQGGVLGYDPMLHTPSQIEVFKKKNIALKAVSKNLIDQIWTARPHAPKGDVFVFNQKLAGKTFKEKLKTVRAQIIEKNAAACLIALPDSLCWLLNIRGQDIDYIPSVQSRLLVMADGAAQWFVDEDKISSDVRKHLGGDIEILPPKTLTKALKAISGDVMMDFKNVPSAFKTKNAVNAPDPCIKPKAIKTPSEIEAIKQTHIADGVAYAHFLYWLDGAKDTVTEIDIADKLLEFRSAHPAFKGLSFPTIAGFGPNGAIIHYRATEETNALLKGNNLLLVDSGAQYYDGEAIAGTTDITRTLAIGKPTAAMKKHYTLVLKAHIGLANAKFPKTATGAQVDVFARAPLWEQGIDYAHGTGHGVGCFLAVHEEAASLSPRGTMPLEAGMLISNEPGYYEEGAYGIRLENLVLCVEKGDMLGFETIGYAPFDRDLIIPEMLSATELQWLNAYHAQIWALMGSRLPKAQAAFLQAHLGSISPAV